MKKNMKKLLGFMLMFLIVIQITPLEIFADTAVIMIDIDVPSVAVGQTAPTSLNHYNNTYEITKVEWSCLYDKNFKAGDVFEEDSTYYLTFSVKAKPGYYLPVNSETGEYSGGFYINGEYDAKAFYTEGDEFVIKVKYVTSTIMNNIYLNVDYSAWTSFMVGLDAFEAQEQFFESVYSIPESCEDKYYVDDSCCELLYKNSDGELCWLDYNHLISDDYTYYMRYWVEAKGRYDFTSDSSKIKVYINSEEVDFENLEYNSSWAAYSFDVKIEAFEAAELTASATVSSNGINYAIGDQATIKVVATGGSGSYTYKYAILNVETGKWSVLQDFTKQDSYTYHLRYPGKKQFVVTVKDGKGNTVSTDRMQIEVRDYLGATLKVDNSTDSLVKGRGSEITLDAIATGGTGVYMYKFAVLNVETGKWSILRDFSEESSYTYTLNYPGEKQFAVTVEDSNGFTVATNRINVTVNKTADKLKATLEGNGSTDSLTKIKGSKLTLQASATGGAGSYKYKFAVLNVDTGKWSVLKDFTTTSTYTYALNYPGKKEFAVTVKDGSGKTIATNRLAVNVVSSVVNNLSVDLLVNGISSSSTVKVGGEIKLIPTVKGGTGNYKYKYVVHNVDNDTWYTLKDYSTDTSYSLKPSSIGKKEFVVSVKDNNGNVVSSSRFGVTVIN